MSTPGLNKREALWVGLGALAFALAFTYPIVLHLGQFGAFHDWDLFTSLTWVPYYSVTHFHQMPLWDPYKCGGIPSIGNQQSRIVTPFFLLHLVFGPVVGMQLDVILHLALAFCGGYVLARSLGLRPIASVVTAAVFPSTSWFYLHVTEGHQTFLAASYLPWAAAMFWISIERKSWTASLGAALMVALTFLEGVVYVTLWAGGLVIALAIGFALVRLSLRPLVSALVIAIFSAGLAAVKLLPALEMFRLYPRAGSGGESNPLWLLAQLVFSRDQDILRRGIWSFGFHEYGAYISIPFVALAAIGIFPSRLRSIPWILAAGFFLFFYMGDAGPKSLWAVLRGLPLFPGGLTAMRLPSRCLIGLVLSVAVLAGLGAELLCEWFGRWGSRIAIALVVAGVADSWLVGVPNLNHIFEIAQPPVNDSMVFRQQAAVGARFNMTHTAQANMGILACYEYTDIVSPAVGYDQPGYKGEQYLAGPGFVRLTRWTPNGLSYDVNAFAPTVLTVNQNYNSGWRLLEGRGNVFSDRGLIGVRIPAGKQHIELVYRSRSFDRGLAISLLTLVAMLAVWRYESRRRKAEPWNPESD